MTHTSATTHPNVFARMGHALLETGREYRDGIRHLKGCPREIWIAYAIKILESLCYFSSVLVLMPFLIGDMGLSDVDAGWVFGIFSASMSLFMLFVGFIADSLGIKKALLFGLGVALVGRLGISFTTEPWVVYPALFFLSVGFAYMIPLIAASVKLFSTRKAQKFAYSWYYVVMNVGSLIAGLTLDSLRAAFTEPLLFRVFGNEVLVRPLQIIFVVGVAATIVSLCLVFFGVREVIPPGEKGEEPAAAAAMPAKAAEKPAKKGAWEIMVEVGREKTFWIFIAFMFLLVLVKMIFQYNHSLYPVYMERIGLKEWTGKLYSINPALIILLVPVVTAATSKMKAYNVILLGTFVSAGSVMFMGLGEAIGLIVAFQVFLSLGEALWSPRLYDYTASIAPPGKEASYMALSKVPMFFAKVVAGPASGFLLANLCAPGGAARNTELMWILVGLSTLVSPLTLLLARRWLDVESRKQREPEATPSAGVSPA